MAEPDPELAHATAPIGAAGADGGVDYRRFAGRALFPRTPSELTDTSRCPACFTALMGPVCRVCALDVSNPVAAEIATLSQDAAALLDRRLIAIGRVRYESSLVVPAAAGDGELSSAQVPAAVSAAVSVDVPVPAMAPASVPVAAPPFPPVPLPPPPLFPAPLPRVTDPAEPGASPRRSSVQVILLIVGISLLSVAAIFFLVYAFINFGILGRSLIIAAVTIASFVVASALRRRSLTATAEGIAVLAVVLVYLDAFAIRANDFFGLAAVDGAAFWGAALLVTAVGFLAWHRASGLRTPRIVAFSAIVPGVALLVGGSTNAANDGGRVFFAFAAATLAGSIHHFASRPATSSHPAFAGRAERVLTLGFTGGALVAAFFTAAAVAPQAAWASTPAYLVVAALCALHTWLVGAASRAPLTALAAILAGVGGISAAVAVASGAIRFGDLTVIVVAAPIAATVVALTLELAWRRSARTATGAPASRPAESRPAFAPSRPAPSRPALSRPAPSRPALSRPAPSRPAWMAAAIGASAVAAVALVPPVVVAVSSTASAVVRAVSSSWTLDPGDELVSRTALAGSAVGALALAVLMFVAARAVTGTLRRLAAICAGSAAVVLVLAVPLLGLLGLVFVAWLVVAAGALGALLWMQRRSLASRLRPPLMVTVGSSGALGYLVGWGSTSTWWVGTIVVVALLLASRMLRETPRWRAVALGTAATLVLIGAAAGARQLALPLLPDPASDLVNALRAVSIVAVVLIVLSAFRLRAGISRLDRRVLFWFGAISAAATVLPLSQVSATAGPQLGPSLLAPEPVASLAVDAALLVALLTAVGGPLAARLPRERVVASIALAPTLALVLDQFARVLELPGLVRSVTSISAALVAAVGVLAVASIRSRQPVETGNESRRGALGSDRLPREIGVLVVVVPSLVIGVLRHDSLTWLVLVLAALVMLALATSADGLFGSSSPRRHLGWASLALGTAGLWWRLGDARVVALEPYVLPVAGVLLFVALMVWRSTRQTATSTPELVAPVITLVALLVAILPLSGAASMGPVLRAVIVFGVSAALLVLGSTMRGTPRSRPYLDSLALAGALGVLTVMTGRSVTLRSGTPAPDIRLDAWLAAGLLVLIVAAFGLARDRVDHSAAWRSVAGQVLGALGLILVLGFEVSAFADTTLGPLRAVAVILLFSAVHVTCFLLDRAPFTRLIGWVAITGAAIAVMGGLVAGALDPVERGTVPLAAALAVTGALTLSREPSARTWPWLAPATLALLVPSLVATAQDPATWRLVALGVVGVAIIVASAILRLQAPFLIAVVVVLIHVIATFAPQIRAVYESVEWWLWFVPVGIAVVVFAARFEKSVLRMRSVAMRIRALR